MNKELNKVLVINGYTQVPSPIEKSKTSIPYVATIVGNMNFYGFTPSKEALDALLSLDVEQLENYWSETKLVLESITASDRNMGDFIVYKNFPQEVLNMSEAEYWLNQIFIYLGCPAEYLREEEKVRPELTQKIDFKILSLAKEDSLQTIYSNLQNKNTKWTDLEKESALTLLKSKAVFVDISDSKFKENGVLLAKYALENGSIIKATNATDVLRLAVEEGSQLRGNVSFRKMKRSERKFFLNLLENSKNLEEDMAMKKSMWKKFLRLLSPSDYHFERVIKAYDKLYNNKLTSFESDYKQALANKDYSKAIALSQSRVGFFVKNIHHLYSLMGMKALTSFLEVAGKATIMQLVKLHKYMSTVNERENFLVAPNGSWSKLQVIKNEKKKITQEDLDAFLCGLSSVINEKLTEKFPNGIVLDEKTKEIKMPTNDLELDSYGRGTSFDIPENIKTIRTASYWKKNDSSKTIWFDNGFNFVGNDFEPLGTCCWDSEFFGNKGAYFSGDPVNSRELLGRACQMIDLDLEKLKEAGVRYACWNVLSYSDITFNEADDLILSMQYCEDALKGNVYEPSRSSMVFRVKGENKVKHIAVIDVKERKVIFLDLNIKGEIQSARRNLKRISEMLPLFMEHLESSVSVYDLFSHYENKLNEYPSFNEEDENFDLSKLPVYIAYTDKDISIPKDAKAFVMSHLNENNSFEKIDLLSI